MSTSSCLEHASGHLFVEAKRAFEPRLGLDINRQLFIECLMDKNGKSMTVSRGAGMTEAIRATGRGLTSDADWTHCRSLPMTRTDFSSFEPSWPPSAVQGRLTVLLTAVI